MDHDRFIEEFRRDLRAFFALQRLLLGLVLFAYVIALGLMVCLISHLSP